MANGKTIRDEVVTLVRRANSGTDDFAVFSVPPGKTMQLRAYIDGVEVDSDSRAEYAAGDLTVEEISAGRTHIGVHVRIVAQAEGTAAAGMTIPVRPK